MELPYISGPNEISNNDYHTSDKYIDFISSSVLKQVAISPKWLKYCKEHPEDIDETKEWKLDGGCYHEMLASICNSGDLTDFNNHCAIFEPPVNPSTGNPYGYDSQKFKDAYNGFSAENPGKEIYSKTEYDHSEVMIKELREGNKHLSGIINNILKIGKAEESCFIQHKANDLIQYDTGLFKWRKDIYTEKKIFDWKGVAAKMGPAPIKSEDFSRVIDNLLYGFSAAMYQYFEWMAFGIWRSFYWIVQDKNPPYDFNIISASQWAFDVENGLMKGIGPHAMIFLKSLEQYLYCHEKDEWHGVSIFTKPDYRDQRIAMAPVPGYTKGKLFDYYN